MIIRVDFDAATAFYRQVVDQVRFAIASGVLKPGDAIPSIRPLAAQLHLNRNTVAKAYSELESLGVIKSIPGKGSFVESADSPLTAKARQELVIAKIDAALVAAHQLQVDPPLFAELVAERTRFFNAKIKESKRPHAGSAESSVQSASDRTVIRPTITAEVPAARKPLKPLPTKAEPQPGPELEPEGWSPEID